MKLLEIYRELIMEAYTGDSSIMIYYVKFETSLDSEILYKGTYFVMQLNFLYQPIIQLNH